MAIDSAGRIGWAVWDPITDRSVKDSGLVRMTLHTAAANVPDIYGPQKGPSGTYAHAYSPTNGKLRQHQEAHHFAYADLDANGKTFAVEHQDAGPSHGIPFSENQLENDARLFADLVIHSRTCSICNVPNRIATVDNTKGLAWHRLGVPGNFPAYDPNNRKTWCYRDTGEKWTTAYGKACPWDERIEQVDEIYKKAQTYISGTFDDQDDTQPTPPPDGDDDMPHEASTGYTGDHTLPADGEWRTLTIGQTDEKKNVYTLITGPALATGTLSVVVRTAKPDTEVDLRTIHVDTKSGESKTVYGGFPLEQFSQGGDTQIVLPFTERVRAADKGWKRNLRFEIKTYGGGKVTVKDARARSLYWPS